MSGSLASFRDLKGIGPATEARLHEAGIYTWEALATAATALAAVRGNGDTLREVANLVATRHGEAGGQAAPRPPGGEHLEAFVLRMALTGDGEPRRCTVTHVRTMAEQAWAGWPPEELTRFVAEHAGVEAASPPAEPPRGEAARRDAAEESPRDGEGAVAPSRRRPTPAAPWRSTEHLVVLDAGKAIGGASRDVDLVVANTRAAGSDFDYRATLAARPLGTGGGSEDWTTVASETGTGSPAQDLALRFPGVELPQGIQRLQLRLEVNLPNPTHRAPALAIG